MNIDKLDISQKIAQLIMPRIDFSDPHSMQRAKELVSEYQVGGFIIFNAARDVLIEATRELQSLSAIPLLFACDAERGAGQIVRDMTVFPFTMSLAASNNEDLVYEQASFIADQMKECGLNLLFAPVADVNSNPENPIINIRSYGDDPELVSKMCSAFIRGCQENGVLACAKHFPGHGRTGVDSHIDLPVLDTNIESLQKNDLIPFQKSIDAGVASIMTAHIAFPKISDGRAVTVSKELISDLLRSNMGFNGLIITDSLHMEGIIKLGEETDISKKALAAGCDIILDPRDPFELAGNLNGTTDPAFDLDAKVKRILRIKEDWLADNTIYNPINEEIGTSLARRIAKESVCVVRGGVLKSKKALVYSFDVTQSEDDISVCFTESLQEYGVSAEGLSASQVEFDELPEEAPDNTAVICVVYTTIGAWKKQSTLPAKFSEVLSRLESAPGETVLISFGSPYVIRAFEGFKTVICSFDILDICQSAAADVLLGKQPAVGKIPVNLD